MKKLILSFILTLSVFSLSFPSIISAQEVRQNNYCSSFGGVCGCDATTGKQVCCEGVLNDSYSCQQPSRLNYPSLAKGFPMTNVYVTAVPNDRGTFSVYVDWTDQAPTEYSVTLTSYPGQDPGPYADTSKPEFAFFDISTGVWYVNMKKNIDGSWSQVTSWKVTVPEWSSAVDQANKDQVVVVDQDPNQKQAGRILAPAASTTKKVSTLINNVPEVLFYVIIFLAVLFVIVVIALITGKDRIKKLEELVHKLRLDVSTIMNFLRKKYPDEKSLVAHSQIKLNGVLSVEEERIVKDVKFDKLFSKYYDYLLEKIKSFKPKDTDDLAYAAYQLMEDIDNKELKHQLENNVKASQWSKHEVNVACADYLAIKISDEVLK